MNLSLELDYVLLHTLHTCRFIFQSVRYDGSEVEGEASPLCEYFRPIIHQAHPTRDGVVFLACPSRMNAMRQTRCSTHNDDANLGLPHLNLSVFLQSQAEADIGSSL